MPELSILTTDDNGFLNHPTAIVNNAAGKRIGVVGLGDFFIHGAAYPFTEFFEQRGIVYYNPAMHRQGPPQYNRILESYAVALKPDMVIYGLYENDFFETLDFEAWLNSSEDWFTYHAGYWCGPASDIPVTVRLFRRYLKGCYSGCRSVRLRLIDDQQPGQPRPIQMDQALDRMMPYFVRAHEFCQARAIAFLVLLILSKDSVVEGAPAEAFLYDRVSATGRYNSISLSIGLKS